MQQIQCTATNTAVLIVDGFLVSPLRVNCGVSYTLHLEAIPVLARVRKIYPNDPVPIYLLDRRTRMHHIADILANRPDQGYDLSMDTGQYVHWTWDNSHTILGMLNCSQSVLDR